MKDDNHPKHRHSWQRHVNELLNRGEYHLVSETAVFDFQRELARCAIEANRAAVAFERLSWYRLPEDEKRMKNRANMWRQWNIQLRTWIADLNNFKPENLALAGHRGCPEEVRGSKEADGRTSITSVRYDHMVAASQTDRG